MILESIFHDSSGKIVLPRGVTGFGHSRVTTRPTTRDKQFRAYCYAVAQQLGGAVKTNETAEGHSTRSFSCETIQLPDECVAVLLNEQFPLIAMALPAAENWLTIDFVEAPALIDEFRKFGCYEVLSLSDVSQRVDDAAISRLFRFEKDQIKYWNPATIGEVIFNFWD